MKLSKSYAVFLCAMAALSTAQARELCTALADTTSGKVVFERGDCQQRVTPASTFKIAISLMGYDAGFLKDAHRPLIPYRQGYLDWRESWQHPTDPAKWMQDSVVWYSQQVSTSLGKQRFAAYARRFDYGNADVSGDADHDGLTLSWISSSLKISPLEQLSFLNKLVNHQLGVTQQAYDMTATLLQFDQSPDGWQIHGKTGAASGYGWYVGWATKGSRSFSFARLIRKEESDPQETSAGVLARDGFIGEYGRIVSQLAL